jgi:hypothetical protein
LSPSPRTRHSWARLTGQVVYALYTMSFPLRHVRSLLLWAASLSPLSWGEEVAPPAAILAELARVFPLLSANPWRTLSVAPSASPTCALSSDASPTGGAASLVTPSSHQQWAWEWDPSTVSPHQIHREALGSLIGLLLAYPSLPPGAPMRLIGDCVPWLSILSSGFSRSDYLQRISDEVWGLLPQSFSTAAVCSAHLWDDGPSRQAPAPPAYWDQSSQPSKLLSPPLCNRVTPPILGHSCSASCPGSDLFQFFLRGSGVGLRCTFCQPQQ